MNRSGNIWWGIALIVVGALLFFNNYFELDFGDLLRTWWPVILVIWGVALLLKYRPDRGPQSGTATAQSPAAEQAQGLDSSEHILQSSVFGDTTVRVASQAFKGGNVSTVFGDTSIDLSSAALADGEQMLKVSGVFGDTTITVPRDMVFSATVNTVMGDATVIDQRKEGFGSTVAFQAPEYKEASKKLRIVSSTVFGDIVVRR